jgi:hypothetical protein
MATDERDDTTSELGAYEPPVLTDYGTIESWTRGVRQIQISIVI